MHGTVRSFAFSVPNAQRQFCSPGYEWFAQICHSLSIATARWPLRRYVFAEAQQPERYPVAFQVDLSENLLQLFSFGSEFDGLTHMLRPLPSVFASIWQRGPAAWTSTTFSLLQSLLLSSHCVDPTHPSENCLHFLASCCGLLSMTDLINCSAHQLNSSMFTGDVESLRSCLLLQEWTTCYLGYGRGHFLY